MRSRAFAGLLLVATCTSAFATDDPRAAAALEAVAKWVPVMDSGDYGKCWDELAQNPKEKIPKEQWLVYMSGVRKPMGELISRKEFKVEYIPSLEGLPDQEGAFVQYQSSFENRSGVIETFGVIREKSGQWRVGYYLTK